MSEKHYLALDMGAESGRGIVATLADGKITLAERHRFANPTGRINGQLHWDILGQWEHLKTALRNSADVPLAGIGIDTWGVDYGYLDKAGNLLGFPHMYRDMRVTGMLKLACDRVGKETIYRTTGIQFMEINTLYQVLCESEAKLTAQKSADLMLFMPDLFNCFFTGVRKSEYSIASTSQMFDMTRGTWAIDMLGKLGIPTHFLPPIVQPGTILGPVKADVAGECGVRGSIPVIAVGAHDTASAVAAVPAEGTDGCYISSGTWSLMGVETPRPIINDTSYKYSYTNEGGVCGTIRFLKNIMGLWLVQECRRQWQREGEDLNYTQITKMAAEARPFVAVLDPDDSTFLTPGDMPRKIAEFCRRTGQAAPASKGEIVRTCLEGLALAYRRVLGELEEMLGRRINVINIVGGGTQNELLNQLAADACGRPVVAGPVEATALGNVLLQAMATGDIKDLAAGRAIIRQSFAMKRYESRASKAWDEAFARHKALRG